MGSLLVVAAVPRLHSDYAAYVYTDGTLSYAGPHVYLSSYGGVRPALWVNVGG